MSSDSDKGIFHNSVLSNMNPAPPALTPPDYSADAKSPTVDAVQMNAQADYHFTLGESYSFQGKSEKAIEEFKLVLIYDPNSVTVRLRLAAEYVRLGLVTEAVQQAETAVKAAPKDEDARMFLGGLYTGLKMYEEAANQFRDVLKLDPEQTEANIYLGAVLAEQNKYSQAVHHFENLTRDKKFAAKEQAYFYLGKIDIERGGSFTAKAEGRLTKALEIKPNYPEAALALGDLYRSENKEKKMAELYQSYQDKFGPNQEMTRRLSRYYLQTEDYASALDQLKTLEGFDKDNLNVKIQIALILIEEKKLPTAASYLEEILARAPELDKVRYYLAAVYEEMGKTDSALKHYQKIPAASTYYAEAVMHSGHLLRQEGRLGDAADFVKKALDQRDDLPKLYAYYATLLDAQKKFPEALAMLHGAVQKFPDDVQLRFFLGSMYDRLGQTDKTIAEMKKVLNIDGHHVQAMNYLAFTYAQLGEHLNDAKALAEEALKLQPHDGYILDTMGWIMYKKGDVNAAIRYLEAAYKARNDESIIAEHLGDAYLRHQMWTKATQMYQRAAELESDDGKAKEIRKKIANVENQRQNTSRLPASVPSTSGQ